MIRSAQKTKIVPWHFTKVSMGISGDVYISPGIPKAPQLKLTQNPWIIGTEVKKTIELRSDTAIQIKSKTPIKSGLLC